MAANPLQNPPARLDSGRLHPCSHPATQIHASPLRNLCAVKVDKADFYFARIYTSIGTPVNV